MLDLPLIQLIIFNIMTLVGLILLIYIKPYTDTKLYRLEVFNESMILILSDMAFIFTDIVPNPTLKNQSAWFFVSFMFMCVMINLLI